MGANDNFWGRLCSLLVALLTLISFGPHKNIDPQFSLIWPAVISGQIAVLVIGFSLVKATFFNSNS